MTKYEIIKALSKSALYDVRYLHLIYHNECDNEGDTTEYVFSYNRKTAKTTRELLAVLMSIYKLRKYVRFINASFVCDGKLLTVKYSDAYAVYQAVDIADFISLTL